MNTLLPYKLKIPGFLLLCLGIILSIIYFVYGLRIILPVFAVYSSFLETKIFTTFKTNFGDEIILLSYILGFSLIVFSKEKKELNSYRRLRIEAIIKTIRIYILWMVFSILFVYGNGFVSILILNILLPFIIYLILFHSLKSKELKMRRYRLLQKKIIQPHKRGNK